MRTRWLAVFCLTITVGLFWDAQTFAGDDSADDRVQRHCFGLIWCVERSADGVSIDGLLWLYSSEERGNYSRLTIRPFYSIEEDPTKNLLRRSILWPLGTYERRGDQVWSHVLPLYWHSEWPGSEWTFVAPLYWKSIHEEDAWYHLFPLFSRHTRGQYYARTFVLGPLLMITRDSRTDLTQWDLFFFIFHSRQDVNSSESWVSPIYWSGKDRASATSYRYVFPLYGSSDSETQHYRFLFPFYGSDVDTEKHTSRLALLGLPPFKGSYGTTTLSLFESATSPDESRHRLFPLYQYRHDLVADETEFDALLLYRHLSTPTRVADRLLPLWDYGSATDGTAWNLSLLGVDTFALYHHRQTEQRTVDRLFPLHDYLRDGAASSLSLLGLAEVALYRQETSPTLFRHRLFPLYQYRHDLVADASLLNVLLVYWQERSPEHAADTLFPLWQYERRNDRDESRFNALGIGRFSLYEHQRETSRTSDRLFPLYRYTSDQDTGEADFSLLWPLVDYKSRHGTVTSASLLWWLISYTHPDADHSAFQVFGGTKMAVIRRVVSPHESLLEINPVISLYRYRSLPEGDTSWDLCYGLIGMDSTRERTRLKLFWISF